MTLRPGEKSLTPTGNPNNYYTKSETNTLLNGKANVATTLAGYGITDGANTALSNLNSNGQMIVDSQNGTISNCVLEIPQNLKLFFDENNILQETIGSINVIPNGDTYTTSTSTQTATYMNDHQSISSYNKYLCFMYSRGSGSIVYPIENTFSGATQPTVTARYCIWYNTSDKYLYNTNDTGTTWIKLTTWSFPVCLLEKDNNNKYQFAKDSNGNDMIFNGAGFVGYHAFVYPNVKVLTPNGFNADGSLKSISYTNNALRIVEMSTTTPASGYEKIIQISQTGAYIANNYKEVERYEDLGTQNYSIQYVHNDNIIYYYTGSVYEIRNIVKIISYNYDGTTVTDFTIRQPVRTATVEMLNSALGDVETLLAAI